MRRNHLVNGYMHELVNNYRGYNRNIKLAMSANVLTQIGMGIFMTLYNLYLRDLGYSELTNGNVIALTALAQTIFLVPAGLLSDRIGRKKVMVFGVLIATLTLLGRAVFEWETLLLVLAFGSGAFMSFIQVSMIPWMAENSNEKQRVHLFSFHFALMMAANVIGNLFGGIFSDFFTYIGGFQPLISLRITLIIGVCFFFTGLIPMLLMKEKLHSQNKKEIGIAHFKGTGTPMENRDVFCRRTVDCWNWFRVSRSLFKFIFC